MGEVAVAELSAPFAISPPAITKHLKVLEQAGLIERSREIGLHVIATRLPGNWAGVSAMSPFLQKLTGSRASTLFMDNDAQTVKVFGRVSAQQLPPGRGVLVTTDGAMEGVLVATPE